MFRKGCLALLLLLLSVSAAYAIDIDELVAKVPAANGGEAGITATSEILVKSYRDIGGTKVLASVLIRLNGELMMTMNINSYKQNVEIADSQFAFPGR